MPEEPSSEAPDDSPAAPVAPAAPPPSRRARWRLHPTVIAAGWVSFFTDLGSEIIYPLLPLFLTEDLGATLLMVGVIEGLAEGLPAIVRLFSGALADRVRNRKWLILGGYGLSSVVKPFIGLARSLGGVAVVGVLRALDKTGKGIRGAPRDALIADCADAESRGYAFGFHRAMDHAGALLGGLVGFALLFWLGVSIKWAIVFSAIPGVLCLLTILLFIREKEGRKPAPPKSRNPLAGTRDLPRVFTLFLIAAVVFALANSSDVFLLLRSYELLKVEHEETVARALIPLLWALLHAVKVVTSVIGGRLSDRVGRRPVLVGGWLLYALVYFGFAFATAAWMVWPLFALYGLFFGATEGTVKALVAALVPEKRRGAAFGLMGMLEGVLLVPASVLAGGLWMWTDSATLPFALCGGISAAAALWLLVAVRGRKA